MKHPKGSGFMTDTQTSNSRSTRRALLASVLALLLCFATLTGTTFAWFTDSASTGVNTIQAGNLGVDLVRADAEGNGASLDNSSAVFANYDSDGNITSVIVNLKLGHKSVKKGASCYYLIDCDSSHPFVSITL
jgi:predicted ribosomally synthesized peptide with SipW-like signal peptide